MNPYTEKIYAFFEEELPARSGSETEALLEMLYCCYTAEHPIDNTAIFERFQQLDRCLDQLEPEKGHKVYTLTCDLCHEHERLAFLEGIRLGFRLYKELTHQ